MRVLVTRPRREAQDWVQALRLAGHDARALPLIAIGGPPEPLVVRQAWQRLQDYRALMFVSANAVDGFFAAGAGTWPAGVAAWATGPGTVQALRRAGLAPSQITAPPADAPQFDSEALWGLVHDSVQPGQRVLIVRGGDAQGRSSEGAGRDWFARQLHSRGAAVDFVASYQRQVPTLEPMLMQLARSAATDGSLWLFSSSEAVRNLRALLPQQSWGRAQALATHERIAEAARAAGFARVRVCRPALADVLASIESGA